MLKIETKNSTYSKNLFFNKLLLLLLLEDCFDCFDFFEDIKKNKKKGKKKEIF